MALNMRDILIVVRARDVGSRVLREVGTNLGGMGRQAEFSRRQLRQLSQTGKFTGDELDALASKASLTSDQVFNMGAALTGAGTVMAASGALGLSFFNDATDAAIEYSSQVAKTYTQVERDTGITMENLAEMGRDMALNIPVPFNETQEVLYDIFSSIEASLSEAEVLANAIARGSVAGVADLNRVGEATIAILNSLNIPIRDVNEVMDFQFNLVRKGIISYDELTANIGKILPSAQIAGQGLEDIGGGLAFITRSIPNAAMASTALARAFELFAHPRVGERLAAIGISVKDSEGNFRSFTDVMVELGRAWDHLPEAERAARMFELIKGAGGTIQARRFLVEALDNWEELGRLTDETTNWAGAMDEAYQVMFEQPHNQIQLLKNQYDVLKTEIGDQLIPVKMELLKVVQELLDWWNSLDEGTQSLIVRIGVFASIMAVVVGVVLIVSGLFLGLVAAIMALGASFGAAVAIIGGVIAGIIALGAAIVAIVMNWDTLKNAATAAWEAITSAASTAWEFIKDVAHDIWQALQRAWDDILAGAQVVWQTLQAGWDSFTDFFVGLWHDAQEGWDNFVAAILAGWDVIQDIWQNNKFIQDVRDTWNLALREMSEVVSAFVETVAHYGERIVAILTEVIDFFKAMGSELGGLFAGIVAMINPVLTVVVGVMTTLAGVIGTGLSKINAIWEAAWRVLEGPVRGALATIGEIIDFVLDFVARLFDKWGDNILDILETIWDSVVDVVQGAINIVSGIIKGFMAFFRGDWKELWESAKQVWNGFWQTLQGGLGFVLGIVSNIIGMALDAINALWQAGWELVKDTFSNVMGAINDAVEAGMQNVINFFRDLPGNIASILSGASKWLLDTGKDIVTGLWNGLKAAFTLLIDWFFGLPQRMLDVFIDFFGIGGKLGPMYDVGANIITGLWNGLQAIWNNLWNWFTSLPGTIIRNWAGSIFWLYDKGLDILQGLWNGIKDVWNRLKGWIGTLGNSIRSAIGDVANLLWDIGKAIIESLWNGMKSKWEDLKGWIGGLAGSIRDLKGPPEKDARLLTEAGHLIFQGLHRGMASEWENVASWLKGIDPASIMDVSDMAMRVESEFNRVTTPPVNAPLQGGGAVVTNTYNTNTLVIEEGAIQISADGLSEEEVEEAVTSALEEIINDWDGR